jgi:prepilin-type N-terminal cleavage/methylation domain-containing protein
MKTPRASLSRSGFTLIELLVAMTITTIIVGVLVSVTSIAIDTWNRSRAELRAARQAKTMVDSMARDFEALVVRNGNDNEWLSATSVSPSGGGTNAARLAFFTAATDRYNGEINGPDQIAGNADDPAGGDVACVGYELNWRNPIQGGSFETFVLNRYLVDPKPAFDNLLGKTDIGALFPWSNLADDENFLCENVFQFTLSFHVEVPNTTGTGGVTNKLVTIMPSGGTTNFSIKGTGLTSLPDDPTLENGRITAVGISLTVLSDAGVDLLRKTPDKASDAAWLAKNSFQYSKLIQLPGM